ncbi:MAG: ABC transporter permease [Acidimicrobiales bacterium]
MPTSDVTQHDAQLDEELAGLDALELAQGTRRPLPRRLWSSAWPKLAAIAIALAAWELVVASGWRPEFVLPPPEKVWDALRQEAQEGTLWTAMQTTLRRAAVGFAMALVIGMVVGAAVSQVKVLRAAFGSFITGLQTMPSIAWFPLAVLLFKRTEAAMYFVVILGAAPSIANGLISGVDTLPPLLLRAGRTMGARGLTMFRHVVLPGAMPSFVGGIKQGWAFAWRSLMAGELIVIIANSRSIGERMENARTLSNTPVLISYMIVILVIGIVLDAFVFGAAERAVRRRWGLVDTAQ